MKLYYHNEKWYHTTNTFKTWGKENSVLTNLPSPSSFFIEVTSDSSCIKPLVGIIAGTNSTKPFTGNEIAFQRIQLALQKAGGLSFVFTPDHLLCERVKGFVYDFSRKRWREAFFPFPDVVYNRIPFRKLEHKEVFQLAKDRLHSLSIPYFNESFFHKWEVFQVLSENNRLLSSLPKTIRLTDIQSFTTMTAQFNSVYVKPCNGKKGKGILYIERDQNDTWNIETIHNRMTNLSYKEVINDWIQPLFDKEYIIQQSISPLKWNGARFDYRVLVHRSSNKNFKISGIGVRQSQGQEVTTHVPAGGKIVPFSELPYQEDKQELQRLAILVGSSLLTFYRNIGEFSMDVGKSENGDLFIFEVNSKPMVFDEDSIRKDGLNHLIQLFSYLADKA